MNNLACGRSLFQPHCFHYKGRNNHNRFDKMRGRILNVFFHMSYVKAKVLNGHSCPLTESVCSRSVLFWLFIVFISFYFCTFVVILQRLNGLKRKKKPLNAISSHFCKVGWKQSLMLLPWMVANTCQRLKIEGK